MQRLGESEATGDADESPFGPAERPESATTEPAIHHTPRRRLLQIYGQLAETGVIELRKVTERQTTIPSLEIQERHRSNGGLHRSDRFESLHWPRASPRLARRTGNRPGNRRPAAGTTQTGGYVAGATARRRIGRAEPRETQGRRQAPASAHDSLL